MKLFERLLGPNISKLESHGNVEALTNIVESDNHLDLRNAAIEALSRIGGPHATGPLITALSDDDSEVAQAAEKAVAGFGSAAGAALIGALDGQGGDAAMRILLSLGNEAIELLRDACGAQDEGARRRALDGLVELDTRLHNDEVRENLFRALLGTLGDRSAECRVFAATKLESLGDARASRALAAQLKDGEDTVRTACRQALKAIAEPAVPYLLDALTDRNPNSRRLAAELLGEVCRGEVRIESRRVALSALADRTSDSNTEIAAAVRRALETIPKDGVIAAQLEFLADPERSDHEDIQEFLNQMLTHGALTPESKTRITERMSSLVFAD